MEHHRKAAKALLKGYAAGEPAAVARAEAVLGERARRRFQLSDAQHVVAREQGYNSWTELKHSREETVVDTGLVYREGEPVLIRIRWRAQWVSLDDQGAAVELAGRPPGWLEVAERIVAEEGMNVGRNGVVGVGGNRRRDIEPIIPRLAETSLAVYEAVVELS
jgi:hypothetical protein